MRMNKINITKEKQNLTCQEKNFLEHAQKPIRFLTTTRRFNSFTTKRQSMDTTRIPIIKPPEYFNF